MSINLTPTIYGPTRCERGIEITARFAYDNSIPVDADEAKLILTMKRAVEVASMIAKVTQGDDGFDMYIEGISLYQSSFFNMFIRAMGYEPRMSYSHWDMNIDIMQYWKDSGLQHDGDLDALLDTWNEEAMSQWSPIDTDSPNAFIPPEDDAEATYDGFCNVILELMMND